MIVSLNLFKNYSSQFPKRGRACSARIHCMIFHAWRPSSCAECHLGGVDLKNYINPDQEKAFGAPVTAGLIDNEKPHESKILTFISSKPEKQNLINNEVRQQEFEAFRA